LGYRSQGPVRILCNNTKPTKALKNKRLSLRFLAGCERRIEPCLPPASSPPPGPVAHAFGPFRPGFPASAAGAFGPCFAARSPLHYSTLSPK